jgi:hypothetical protein
MRLAPPLGIAAPFTSADRPANSSSELRYPTPDRTISMVVSDSTSTEADAAFSLEEGYTCP